MALLLMSVIEPRHRLMGEVREETANCWGGGIHLVNMCWSLSICTLENLSPYVYRDLVLVPANKIRKDSRKNKSFLKKSAVT